MRESLTIWLISVIGMGEMVFSELCGSDEALGVGDTPGDPGWTFTTLSFDVRLGDNLEGKLRVFVHWDKLRTIVASPCAQSTSLYFTRVHCPRPESESTSARVFSTAVEARMRWRPQKFGREQQSRLQPAFKLWLDMRAWRGQARLCGVRVHGCVCVRAGLHIMHCCCRPTKGQGRDWFSFVYCLRLLRYSIKSTYNFFCMEM